MIKLMTKVFVDDQQNHFVLDDVTRLFVFFFLVCLVCGEIEAAE